MTEPISKLSEDPMVAFYRRDNDELRTFLTAERIENNALRAQIGDLKMAVGLFVGWIEGVRTILSDITLPEMEWSDSASADILKQVRALVDSKIPTAK